MKNWIKGIGVVGLLLVGCGTETVSAPEQTTETVVANNNITYIENDDVEMNKVKIELCGIMIPTRADLEPSEGCKSETEVIWGEINEEDIKISSYVVDRDALGRGSSNIPGMLHVIRGNTHGCVVDNPKVPAEKQEFVIGQEEFSADNADITVSMTLEPVTGTLRDSLISNAEGLSRRVVYKNNCPSWEERQAELEEDNAYTFFQ